jgi:hypothetical protein
MFVRQGQKALAGAKVNQHVIATPGRLDQMHAEAQAGAALQAATVGLTPQPVLGSPEASLAQDVVQPFDKRYRPLVRTRSNAEKILYPAPQFFCRQKGVAYIRNTAAGFHIIQDFQRQTRH